MGGEGFPSALGGCAVKDENRMSEKTEAPESMLETDLASLHTQFMLLIKEFLLKWCDEEIHSVIREHAAKAKALGSTGLHQMKTEYEEFVNRIPNEIDKVFASGKYWPHLTRSEDLSEETPEGGFTLEILHDRLSDGIRDIQGRLGSLLTKYQFASARDSKWGVDDDDRMGHLRFMSKFIFTGEMNSILKKYLELVSQLEEQSELTTEQKQEKLEEEAENSWDQA